MTGKELSRVTAERRPTEGALPPCPECGAAISFAAAPGGAIEWWRCTGCQRFFAVRNSNCAHAPRDSARCAHCGGSNVAVTVSVRDGPQEITMHFCSVAHARRALPDE
jgi:hypothetical protein